MQSLSVRRFPKLRRWIWTDAVADLPALALDKRRTGSGLHALALALNKRLADDAGKSNANLIFSPVSVYAALSLVAAGARERTLVEMLAVLGAQSRDVLTWSVRALAEQALADRSQAGGPRINFACAVWREKTMPLRPAYADAAVKSYKAQTRAVDFRTKPAEAGSQINLIPSIVDPRALSNLTNLMVANAIYFKGKWHKPFLKECTEVDQFHRLDGGTVDVTFMCDDGKHRVACHDGFMVLQLYYETGRPLPAQPSPRYFMCVFLPEARDGLWRLIDNIACNPGFLRQHLPRRTVSVGELRLPKFKLAYFTNMNPILSDVGLKDAFVLGKAHLSDKVEDGPDTSPALDEVFQKAVIEVNEEGTEAAAVTASSGRSIMACQQPPVSVDFVADHPFAFFMMEEVSGAILFAGQCHDLGHGLVTGVVVGRVFGPASLLCVGLGPCTEPICACLLPDERHGR